jgi:hypothetical protein
MTTLGVAKNKKETLQGLNKLRWKFMNVKQIIVISFKYSYDAVKILTTMTKICNGMKMS